MGTYALTTGLTDLIMQPPLTVCVTPDLTRAAGELGSRACLLLSPRVPVPVCLPLACTASIGLGATGLLGRVDVFQIRIWLTVWLDNCKI